MSQKNLVVVLRSSNKENQPIRESNESIENCSIEKLMPEVKFSKYLSESTCIETMINLSDLSEKSEIEEDEDSELSFSQCISTENQKFQQTAYNQKQTITREQNDRNSFNELSNYDFQEIIGSGEFGEVYRAIYQPLQLEIAIKVIKISKFEVEYKKYIINFVMNEKLVCQKMKSMSHLQYLPKTYAVFEHDHDAYIVTELFYGFTLQNLIKYPEISLQPQHIKYYLFALITAIKELHHDLSSIHRDIKPENIMILANGRLKLIDFGCSKELPADIKSSSVIGTYQYFSPERFQSEYGKQADIWAFAIIAYEIVFKDLPFTFKEIDFCEEEEKFARLSKIIRKRKHFKIKEEELIEEGLREIIEGVINASKQEREQIWTIDYILNSQYFQQYRNPTSIDIEPPLNFSLECIEKIKLFSKDKQCQIDNNSEDGG